MERLSARNLATLNADVRRPAYDRDGARVGIAHLGVGAFMRSHIAVYCDDAMEAAGNDWAIAGVSLRRPAVRDRLSSQDCLYVVGLRGGTNESRRLIGALKSMQVAPEDPPAVLSLLADPKVRVITLTVTEKGYCLDSDSGELALAHPDILHDLQQPLAPRSAIGFLTAALQQRKAMSVRPPNVVSCDNIPGNGSRLRAAVLRFAAEIDNELEAWIGENVAFPATMVDRIVPATTEPDIERNAAITGLRDEGYVKTEPFRQWVIEDNFCNDRPHWEAGGALVVPDVEPFESAKLRLLNGPHSTIAYLGYLAGFDYVHEAMENRYFVRFLQEMMTNDIAPVTPEPGPMNHAVYIDDLLRRFANPALEHRTWQIAMDGSQKLPQRILATVRAQLQRGGPVASFGLAVAGWMRFVLGRDESGTAFEVSDPLAPVFAAIAAENPDSPTEIAERFFAIRQIFAADVAENRRFRSAVVESLRELLLHGAAETVRRFVELERVT